MIGMTLQVLTILVLALTLWAVIRQARAAEELTKATRQQIETGQEQARAAKEQVEVARRQVAESLRPMLTFRSAVPMGTIDGFGPSTRIEVQNDGTGAALDVWWSIGKFGDASMTINLVRLQSGIIPPGRSANFPVRDSLALTKGVVIIYRSLAGIDSVTDLRWDQRDWIPTYIPNDSDWSRTLLGSRGENL